MKKIIGVYNANSGFAGEMNYIIGKILNKRHCALCDITHGNTYSGKKEWIELANNFPITIETVHINEMDDKTKNIVGNNTPSVVYFENDNGRVILNSYELENMNKDPVEFFNILSDKLNIKK